MCESQWQMEADDHTLNMESHGNILERSQSIAGNGVDF